MAAFSVGDLFLFSANKLVSSVSFFSEILQAAFLTVMVEKFCFK